MSETKSYFETLQATETLIQEDHFSDGNDPIEELEQNWREALEEEQRLKNAPPMTEEQRKEWELVGTILKKRMVSLKRQWEAAGIIVKKKKR